MRCALVVSEERVDRAIRHEVSRLDSCDKKRTVRLPELEASVSGCL